MNLRQGDLQGTGLGHKSRVSPSQLRSLFQILAKLEGGGKRVILLMWRKREECLPTIRCKFWFGCPLVPFVKELNDRGRNTPDGHKLGQHPEI